MFILFVIIIIDTVQQKTHIQWELGRLNNIVLDHRTETMIVLVRICSE